MSEVSSHRSTVRKPFWHIHDRVVVFRAGRVTVVSFGLWVALAWAVGGAVALVRLSQAGLLPGSPAPFLAIGIPVLAILGSRLLEILVNLKAYVAAPGRKLPETGFAFQGALVLCTLVLIGTAETRGLPVLRLLDALALGLPLGHAFGRLGCLAYGCCHGRPTGSRVSIRYEDPNSKPVWKEGLSGVPLHPTQLYSALGDVALFLLLNGLAQIGPLREGSLAALYLVVNSAGRFGTEFIRWPRPTPGRLLKPFQWTSLGLFAAGLGLFAWSANSGPFDFSLSADAWRFVAEAAGRSGWLLAGSLVLFLGFGLHGRHVGRYFG
ncbi:MAG: prolipoprotein diacylglyceryl transferase [Deltaproteobacteria bacterium]|nr:prolipoprotein diacylglyceryl transferase [Deltaproteobacteria bacterium]